MIFDHNSPEYVRSTEYLGASRYNGAYYYSIEIVQNIIPKVRTSRNWVTLNSPGCCFDHSVVFIHNNVNPRLYDWLAGYDDLVLVCGIPSTCKKVAHLGKSVYLPLSIDTEYVRQFSCDKDRDACFAGRLEKARENRMPQGVDVIGGMPRDELLAQVARYRRCYAVGRTAIEAACLGCEIKFYDQRFRDTSFWKVVDNSEAAEILQGILDGIDGGKA